MKPNAEVSLFEMPAVPLPELRMLPPPTDMRPPPRVVRLQTTISGQDTYSTRPGYGLTPERIFNIFRQAELGDVAGQCDLFEDVAENDGHLGGLIAGRIEAVSGRPWLIKPGDSKPASMLAARALEDALVRTNIDELIEHHLMAVFMGWSLTEVQWDFVDGWWVPVWFHNEPHRRFRFDSESDEPLYTTEANPYPGERLRGSWMYTTTRHRIAARGGLLRGATWWSCFKRMSVRDWIVFAEKFGIPVPIGVYKSNADATTIAALQQAVLDLGEAGAAVMSELAEITFAEVPMRSGSVEGLHPSIVALCNSEQSKLIAGATLSVETGGPGSFALGKVHEGRGHVLALRDAGRLASSFRRWIGSLFLRFNGITGARPPALVCQVLPERDPLTHAQIASILANDLGLALDEGQLRDEFGFRPPAEGTSPVTGTKNTTEPSDDDGKAADDSPERE